MKPVLHDVQNEEDNVRIPKMGDAIGLIRDITPEGPSNSVFIRRGEKLDLFAMSYAFKYALVIEAIVHAQLDPMEIDEVNKADLEEWRYALIHAVLAIRCVPPMNIGARQNHRWDRFKRGGFLAHQMCWRMLNCIAHRERGTPWPTPKEAMRASVLDYMKMVIKSGRTYEDENDYKGKPWFADTPEQLKLIYRIDPALLGRYEKMPESTELKDIDGHFIKYLDMVFSVEANPDARVDLIKNTWDIMSNKPVSTTTLPDNVSMDY